MKINDLRVHGECHVVIKYINIARKQAIIVKDANRFHNSRMGNAAVEIFGDEKIVYSLNYVSFVLYMSFIHPLCSRSS
jgi:hypothetical protein